MYQFFIPIHKFFRVIFIKFLRMSHKLQVLLKYVPISSLFSASSTFQVVAVTLFSLPHLGQKIIRLPSSFTIILNTFSLIQTSRFSCSSFAILLFSISSSLCCFLFLFSFTFDSCFSSFSSFF